MELQRFKGKIAFITGGTKGLGKAIALRFAAEGSDVAVGFLTNRQDASSTIEEIEKHGVRAIAVRGNVANEVHFGRMFEKIESELGGLDFFISNAASGVLKPAIELTEKDWQMSVDSIARALLVGAQMAVPLMEKRGSGKIVGMASMGAARVMKNYSAIGAAKAAMESLIRYLGMELAPKNINVNAVSAGVTETRSLNMFPNADEMKDLARKFTPTGRLTKPEDVAGVVAFLCSEDANWIVGETIMVDGGLTLRS